MAIPPLVLCFVVFPCLSFCQFRITLRFPFSEFTLAFLGFVICDDVGKNAAGDGFDGVLRNIGIVYRLVFARQKFLIPPDDIDFCVGVRIVAREADLLSGFVLFDTRTDLCRSSR